MASYRAGSRGYGVTSLVDLGLPVMMTDVDIKLRQAFEDIFGPAVNDAGCPRAGQENSLSVA